MTSEDLFYGLYKLDLVPKELFPSWWPNAGEFEVVIGMILTQQSKWEKVVRSIENVKKLDLFSIEKLATVEIWVLAQAIVPSGLYNQKAARIQSLCQNILKSYESVENFRENTTRDWLLLQKGIGEESADSILNYYCFQETMVIDSYTNRLLKAFGFTFEKYRDLQEWFEDGLDTEKISKELGIKPYEVYQLFHGMIVEYCKIHSSRSGVDVSSLQLS